jgi:type IV pilus assembly protein PilY1
MVADKSVDPNVVFIIDDSSSMYALYMPDEAPGGTHPTYSALVNRQYYNPNVTYQPPFYHDPSLNKLNRYQNSDQRTTFPRVLKDGYKGTSEVTLRVGLGDHPNPNEPSTNLNTSLGRYRPDSQGYAYGAYTEEPYHDVDTAVYYDYIPGYSSMRDNANYSASNPYYEDGVLKYSGEKPEESQHNYEYWAFRNAEKGAYFRKNGVVPGYAERSANENQEQIAGRACPTLFTDVGDSRAFWKDLGFTMSDGQGLPHAQCRYSVRVWDVDVSGVVQNFTSTNYYPGTNPGSAYDPLNLPHGRLWCQRTTRYEDETDAAGTYYGTAGAYPRPWRPFPQVADHLQTARSEVTCFSGRHVIGDTNGDGAYDANDDPNAPVAHFEFTPGTSSTATRADALCDGANGVCTNLNGPEQSLQHLVTTFVDDDGELRVEAVPRRRTGKEEIRNYMNWYSYYRTRAMSMRAGATLAFAQLVDRTDTTKPGTVLNGKGIRLGWDTINSSSSRNNVGRPIQGVAPFLNFGANATIQGVAVADYNNRKFVKSFYDWITKVPTPNSTPLRESLDKIGKYYMTAQPWKEYPPANTTGSGSGSEHSCRRSFSILMTDGYWNDSAPIGINDADKVNGPTIHQTDANCAPLRSYQYTAQSPFFGENSGYPVSGSLADTAMYYWNHDLRPQSTPSGVTCASSVSYGANNTLAPTRKDPAFWQHMQTFTVGLGVQGRLSDTEVNSFLADPDRVRSKNILWTNPTGLDTDYETIDDLMHAGLNGHGGTMAASDAAEFATKLTALLNEIAGEASSNSSFAGTDKKLSADSLQYVASYDPTTWSGEVLAYELCLGTHTASGKACDHAGDHVAPALWSLTDTLGGMDWEKRNIFTWTGSTGALFNSSLPSDVKDAINAATGPDGDACPISHGPIPCQAGSGANRTAYSVDLLIDYLRGNPKHEDPGGSSIYPEGFRSRSTRDTNGNTIRHLLGDILYSDPIVAGAFDYGYGKASALTDAQRAAYATRVAGFRDTDGKVAIAETLLVSANDGMLHGFDARTGEEHFAFIPQGVQGHLKKLANPDYEHQFYVDGSPTVSDVWLSSVGAWRRVAVNSSGRGGRSFFALNVENPASFGAGDVLWEVNSSDDGDLGTPANVDAQIGLLPDGSWHAVFGNGYNSDNHHAALFIVKIDDGSIRKIDTGVGDASAPNGLSSPVLLDADGDGDMDLAYAGDALGNLWKFNLTANTAQNLLQATDSSGNPQPISAPPMVVPVPASAATPAGSFQVVVGTGKFFEQSDVSDTQLQTVYGVRDCGILAGCAVTSASRGDMLARTFLSGHPTTDTFTNKGSSTTLSLSSWKLDIVDANADGVDDGVNYLTQRGYYIDLTVPPMPSGSRVVNRSQMLRKNALVPLLAPSDDPCLSAISGGFMEINPFTGGYVKSEIFLTENGSNVYWGTGGLAEVTITEDGKVYMPGLPGEPGTALDLLGSNRRGRQSWRQLR